MGVIRFTRYPRFKTPQRSVILLMESFGILSLVKPIVIIHCFICLETPVFTVARRPPEALVCSLSNITEARKRSGVTGATGPPLQFSSVSRPFAI